jgi:hypothetical protein
MDMLRSYSDPKQRASQTRSDVPHFLHFLTSRGIEFISLSFLFFRLHRFEGVEGDPVNLPPPKAPLGFDGGMSPTSRSSQR